MIDTSGDPGTIIRFIGKLTMKDTHFKYHTFNFSEKNSQNTGLFFDSGAKLFKSFLNSFNEFL